MCFFFSFFFYIGSMVSQLCLHFKNKCKTVVYTGGSCADFYFFFYPPPVIMWRNYLMLISHVSTHNCGLYITFILNYALTAATAAQILHPTV